MQSAPQLTRIWLRIVIVYPLKAPPKKLKLSSRKTLDGIAEQKKIKATEI